MIVIYHANCPDGFTSAWVVHLKYPDATFVAANYGDEPPDVTDQDVMIVDFSFPRATLLDMHAKAKSLVVLDHHKSAQADLDGLDFCVFDMDRSGARLTWHHLFGLTPALSLVLYVEDRDLWRFALPRSREISAYLATLPRDWSSWDRASGKIVADFETTAELGAVALRVTEQYVESQLPRARRVCIGGETVPCINTTFAVSELVGELAEGQPFAAGWFQREDGKFIYSLRSRGEAAADVSLIARQYGGGGHARAAGFMTDSLLK